MRLTNSLAGDACEIVLEGPDRGVPKGRAIPPGLISYAGSYQKLCGKAIAAEFLWYKQPRAKSCVVVN
jgi:hypothetical protein